MKKGLVTLFLASVIAASVSSFAMAPTVRNLPDIIIGDQDDNIGATDNNWFVFTNAFQFDNFASDTDSTVSELKWSFDELEGSQRWYEVNGQQAIHLVDTSADDATSDSAHRNPTTGELRAGHPYASFRDIVFSPGPGDGPYSDPTADHSSGHLVRFLVSDTENVTRAHSIIVKTVDDARDKASGANIIVYKDDTFDTSNVGTAGGASGWAPLGESTVAQTNYSSGLVAYDWDLTTQAYRGRVYTSYNAASGFQRYRDAGFVCNQTEWMPFNVIGSDNYVRVKYYMFAQEGSSGAFANTNVIPNLRLRVAFRYALTQQLELTHHSNTDPGNATWAAELRPSLNPSAPSLYRVDLAPIPVQYLQNNASFEGVLRGFDAFALEDQEAGYIGMTEAVIGTYPKALVEGSNATLLQAYDTLNALKVYASSEKGGFGQPYNMFYNLSTYVEGCWPSYETTGNLGTYTENTSSITLDAANVPDNRSAIITRDFNPDANTYNYAAHPRVEAGKQYMVKFHMTSTQNTNRQCPMNLRARTIKFAWTSKLELGGPWGSGGTDANPGANNSIAQGILPGVGCQNPYKEASENGGWYTIIMHSPIYTEIGNAQTAIRALPGPGENLDSRRDIRVGCDMIDTMDSTPTYAALEKGNYTIDKIMVYSSPLVAD